MTDSSFAAPPSRIPVALQAVFLASNRGYEVNKPPPEQVASKVFGSNNLQRSVSSDAAQQLSRKWREIGQFRKLSFADSSTLSVEDALKVDSFHRRSSSLQDVVSDKFKLLKAKRRYSLKKLQLDFPPSLSPMDYLDAMIRQRGYSTRRFETLQTAYYNKPTPLQQASYHANLVELVRKGDAKKFREVMSTGISLNPCNQYGESLVHMICRRGDTEFLQIMVDLGCSLQVSDDYGRTPLHDACWTVKPCFDVVDIILKHDQRLFHLADCRGAVPLSYIRKDNWCAWLRFLESRKDVFWPHRDVNKLGPEAQPELTKSGPDTRPLPDPFKSVFPELAVMLASGKIEPYEADFLRTDFSEFIDEDDTCFTGSFSCFKLDDSDSTEDFDDDDDDDDDDFDSSCSSIDVDEEIKVVTYLAARYCGVHLSDDKGLDTVSKGVSQETMSRGKGLRSCSQAVVPPATPSHAASLCPGYYFL